MYENQLSVLFRTFENGIFIFSMADQGDLLIAQIVRGTVHVIFDFGSLFFSRTFPYFSRTFPVLSMRLKARRSICVDHNFKTVQSAKMDVLWNVQSGIISRACKLRFRREDVGFQCGNTGLQIQPIWCDCPLSDFTISFYYAKDILSFFCYSNISCGSI